MPNILQLVANLFTFPYIAKNLSPHDFAIIGFFNSVQQLFAPLFSLALYNYYMVEYHNNGNEKNHNNLMNIILFLSILNIITTLVGLALITLYFKIASVYLPLLPFSIIVLLSNYFNIYRIFFLTKCKMEKKGKAYFFVYSIHALLSVGLAFLFVVPLKLGAEGRLGAILAANLIIGVITFTLVFSKFSFDLKIIKEALRICYPLAIVGMLNFPLREYDKILLERTNNVEEFALYNVASAIIRYFFIVGASLKQAFEPDIYKAVYQRNKKEIVVYIVSIASILFLINISFLLFSKDIISLLTGDKYTDAYKYTNILIWDAFLFTFINLLLAILIALKETKIILEIKITISIISLVALYFFVDKWNFFGAAYGRICVNIIFLILVIYSMMRKRFLRISKPQDNTPQ